MKICNKCEKKKPIEEYGSYAGVQNLQCIRCCAMAKAAAKKLKESRAHKSSGLDAKANAFNWRTFVQPVSRDLYEPLKESNRYGEARV